MDDAARKLLLQDIRLIKYAISEYLVYKNVDQLIDAILSITRHSQEIIEATNMTEESK